MREIRQRVSSSALSMYFIVQCWMPDMINKIMNRVGYSPYARTYKYICLQNQLAHHNNKKRVSASVASNLSLKPNTQANKTRVSCEVSSSQVGRGKLEEEPRVIHKHRHHQNSIKHEMEMENERFRRKLLNTQCRVFSYRESQEHFKRCVGYRDLAMRFDGGGKRKDLIYFPNQSSMLTLASSHLSSSRQFCNLPSRPQSARRYH